MNQNSDIVEEIAKELGLAKEEVFHELKAVMEDIPYISAYRNSTNK